MTVTDAERSCGDPADNVAKTVIDSPPWHLRHDSLRTATGGQTGSQLDTLHAVAAPSVQTTRRALDISREALNVCRDPFNVQNAGGSRQTVAAQSAKTLELQADRYAKDWL